MKDEYYRDDFLECVKMECIIQDIRDGSVGATSIYLSAVEIPEHLIQTAIRDGEDSSNDIIQMLVESFMDWENRKAEKPKWMIEPTEEGE